MFLFAAMGMLLLPPMYLACWTRMCQNMQPEVGGLGRSMLLAANENPPRPHAALLFSGLNTLPIGHPLPADPEGHW